MTAVWSRVSSSVCLAGFSSRDIIVAKSALLLNHARARKRRTTSTRRQSRARSFFPALPMAQDRRQCQDGFFLSVPLQSANGATAVFFRVIPLTTLFLIGNIKSRSAVADRLDNLLSFGYHVLTKMIVRDGSLLQIRVSDSVASVIGRQTDDTRMGYFFCYRNYSFFSRVVNTRLNYCNGFSGFFPLSLMFGFLFSCTTM